MFKKLVLFVPLLVLALLTLSAFSGGGRDFFIPQDSFSGSVDQLVHSAALSPSAKASSVSSSVVSAAPVLVPTGPTGPQWYEYGPLSLATGFAAPVVFQQYEYGPFSLATGFAAQVVYQQYEYGPFSLATGFAAPAGK